MHKELSMNNGLTIPVVGLGTFLASDEDIRKSVKEAIRLGYRLIDTAAMYGNEEPIGEAVRECISEGLLKRDDIRISTKLWNDCHHPDDVEFGCQDSINKLGLGPIDLYLMHWPVAYERVNRDNPNREVHNICDDYHFCSTWTAMEDLVNKGLVKSIGVSNFNISQLKELLQTCTIKPVVNQIEVHARLLRMDLINFCKESRIVVQAYAPIGSPGAVSAYKNNTNTDILSDPIVKKIAETHSVSSAAVLLRLLLQLELVVLPKSTNPKRIASNIDLFNFELLSEEVEQLMSLHDGTFYYPCSGMETSKFYPFNELKQL